MNRYWISLFLTLFLTTQSVSVIASIHQNHHIISVTHSINHHTHAVDDQHHHNQHVASEDELGNEHHHHHSHHFPQSQWIPQEINITFNDGVYLLDKNYRSPKLGHYIQSLFRPPRA